ncbi:DUF4224 domain-containing protein [Methyloversatilis sp.]|uniref:DUF4224 domain-containing protein n=1 Tax=Methyloversatilis sp. TaxID=2569862 RepID=UPI0035232796
MTGEKSLFLTSDEIADICRPLKQPAAQIRYLRSLGMVVQAKPNGRPLVVRDHAAFVLSGGKLKESEPHEVIRRSVPDKERFLANLQASREKARARKKTGGTSGGTK